MIFIIQQFMQKNSRNYIDLIGEKIRQYEQNVVQNGQLPQGQKKNFLPPSEPLYSKFSSWKKPTNYLSLWNKKCNFPYEQH